jgi:hypothetical protein
MYDAIEIRKRARHCIEQADEPDKSPSQQLALLRMATVLLEIADDAECINRLIGAAVTGAKPHRDS